MKVGQFVEVEWRDAAAAAAADFDAAVHHRPTVMFTRGWIMKQDAAGVSVCCERYQEEEKWHYRQPTFVPAEIVVRLRRIGR